MGHARGRTPSHRRCAAAQARPCRGGHAAAWHRPARATVPFVFALCTLTVTIAPGFERHTARTRPRRWTSPSRTARAAASVSLSPAEPNSVPWVVYPFTYTLPDPIPARIKPRSTEIGEIRRAPCRAAAEQGTPVTCAATPRPICPDPSDPDSTRAIRSWIHQILTARSRSNGPRSKIPVRSVFLLKSPSLS